MYVLVMGIYRAHVSKRLGPVTFCLSLPFVAVGLIMDAFANMTIAALIFCEFPRELLVTARLQRYVGQGAGWRIEAGTNGRPVAVDPPSTPLAKLLERAKDDLRIMREPMLSAVTGMCWEASEAGDATLVQEARNIRNALRDITDDHALNAAQTYEEMRAAGVAAYRRIAAGASPAFAATFKEITGA